MFVAWVTHEKYVKATTKKNNESSFPSLIKRDSHSTKLFSHIIATSRWSFKCMFPHPIGVN